MIEDQKAPARLAFVNLTQINMDSKVRKRHDKWKQISIRSSAGECGDISKRERERQIGSVKEKQLKRQ